MMDLVQHTISRLSLDCFGIPFGIRAEYDQKGSDRIFVRVFYLAPCTKTGEMLSWRGRKWYLSSHMTVDEIIKTCFAAYKADVEHEVMETFKVDGKILLIHMSTTWNYLKFLIARLREIKELLLRK